MTRVLCAAVVAASLLSATAAVAQSSAPVRLGVLGGASFATLGGDDVNDPGTRTGFVGGASVLIPLRGRLSLEMNGLYSQKGAHDSEGGESLTLKLNYLEFPLLLRYDFASQGIRPFLSGGVSFAYKLSCKAKGAAEGISAEVDCDDLNDENGGLLDVKDFDTGVAFGGGLDFPLANDRMITVGARYTLGVTDIMKLLTVRNRAFQLYAGFSLPLR